MSNSGVGATYVFSFKFLTADFLNCIIQLMLSAEVGIGEDLLIKGPRVCDDSSDIHANIARIGSGTRHVTVASNSSIVEKKVTIDAAGGQAREADLIPPTDVDNGIRKVKPLKMVQYSLLLQTWVICQSSKVQTRK